MPDANQPALDLAAIRARADAAGDELDRMTSAVGGPGSSWRWSIPANPERDSDLILAASLTDVPALVAEVERLRQWKADAEELLADANAENVTLREALARVEALVSATAACASHDLSRADGCDECVKVEGVAEYDITLRAALDQPFELDERGES